MPTWLMLVGAAVALYALHRLALWMEQRGWIYYLKKQPSSTAMGSAFLEVHKILQPEKKHLIEAKQQQKTEQDDAGASGDPTR